MSLETAPESETHVIRDEVLPRDIEQRLEGLGAILDGCPDVLFAYLFGGASVGRLTQLSDVDVAVYLADVWDGTDQIAGLVAKVTAHLGTDEVDLIVLNTAPTVLLGRILRTRQVICDRAALCAASVRVSNAPRVLRLSRVRATSPRSAVWPWLT